MREIKVLVVAGSCPRLELLSGALGTDKELHIIAQAANAYAARDKIIECRPDVMLLCDELPRMRGITFLGKLMPQYPLPTVVLCAPEREKAAYAAGAAAVLGHQQTKEIPFYLKHAYRQSMGEPPDMPLSHIINIKKAADNGIRLIAMGASTGGTEAMYQVVKELKKDIPGIVMVQHMPAGFTRMYAQRLQQECEVDAKEAQTGDVVRRGQILLAPGDKHMRLVKVNGVYQVECRAGEKVSGHCPSVDVLFASVAKTAGAKAIGVLMTGMGQDGADGLLQMRRAGALTIGQDERTSVVYGMPKAAYDMGAVEYQVPLEQIASKIYYLLQKKSK